MCACVQRISRASRTKERKKRTWFIWILVRYIHIIYVCYVMLHELYTRGRGWNLFSSSVGGATAEERRTVGYKDKCFTVSVSGGFFGHIYTRWINQIRIIIKIIWVRNKKKKCKQWNLLIFTITMPYGQLNSLVCIGCATFENESMIEKGAHRISMNCCPLKAAIFIG